MHNVGAEPLILGREGEMEGGREGGREGREGGREGGGIRVVYALEI